MNASIRAGEWDLEIAAEQAFESTRVVTAFLDCFPWASRQSLLFHTMDQVIAVTPTPSQDLVSAMETAGGHDVGFERN